MEWPLWIIGVAVVIAIVAGFKDANRKWRQDHTCNNCHKQNCHGEIVYMKPSMIVSTHKCDSCEATWYSYC